METINLARRKPELINLLNMKNRLILLQNIKEYLGSEGGTCGISRDYLQVGERTAAVAAHG
jgi:hypothetical protein